MNRNRPIAGLTAALLVCWAQVTGAQTVTLASPTDFAVASSACIGAVTPDKLDPTKLEALGWVKQSDDRAPFGPTAIFTRAGSPVRLFVSPSPSGYCIVDGYGQDFGQYETFQSAVADRLKTDYGSSGLTGVTIGKPGDDDRRQGFLIGNAVAGYSGTMRPGGLNLRFTVVNTKFAGSPQVFQTSRPPLSEAELAENRAKDRAAADFAKQPGTAQDLIAMAKDCATALRGDGALPGNGWRKSIHASGTPRSVEAPKSRDTNAMMAGMAHTRQLLYFVGRHGLVTKYYIRGVTNVCEATIYVDPPAAEAIKAEAMAALGLTKGQSPSGKATDFAAQYAVTDLTQTYQWQQSEFGVRKGNGTSLDAPDSTKTSISIFVF